MFAHDIGIRRYAEPENTIAHWTDTPDRGGHFAALEEPNYSPTTSAPFSATNADHLTMGQRSVIPSEAFSDALRLARLARSTSRRSRSLARVGRCGLTGAEASDWR